MLDLCYQAAMEALNSAWIEVDHMYRDGQPDQRLIQIKSFIFNASHQLKGVHSEIHPNCTVTTAPHSAIRAYDPHTTAGDGPNGD